MKKLLITSAAAALLSTGALADNVLVIGSYGNADDAIVSALESFDHTVTQTENVPTSLDGYEQVWDLRIYSAISDSDSALYDTHLRNSGFLYLTGENAGFVVRNNSISDFVSTLGGGAITVGGSPANDQNGNETYFSSGSEVEYAAAANINNDGGTGRVLSSDGSGGATSMLWVGNAGDLGDEYTGTVTVVADVNWTMAQFFNSGNELFLDELISGIVAGTVSGTINENGNDGGGSQVTLSDVSPGVSIFARTTTPGDTTTTYSGQNVVTESDDSQTVESTLTTTVTESTIVETCETPTTVSTYSDGSTTTGYGDQSCSTETETESTSSNEVVVVTGSTDQLSSMQSIVNSTNRGIEFSGFKAFGAEHELSNGMSGSTKGITLGGSTVDDNGTIIGAGIASINSSIDGSESSASSETILAELKLARYMMKGKLEVGIQYASTDFAYGRTIGSWANQGSTSGYDTNIRLMYSSKMMNERLTPIVGVTKGKASTDGYVETGEALTARTVSEVSENYEYATIGVSFKVAEGLDLTAIRHTDGVNTYSLDIKRNLGKYDNASIKLGLDRVLTNQGSTNSVDFGISLNF